jgi:MFS family permease
MFGCFVGGWAADSIGRINGIFYAAIVALVGGILQASSQGAEMIIVARVVTGLGTGGKYQKPAAKFCVIY